jgi:hypothetical protein
MFYSTYFFFDNAFSKPDLWFVPMPLKNYYSLDGSMYIELLDLVDLFIMLPITSALFSFFD